jgi:alpha,alpha-trehalase
MTRVDVPSALDKLDEISTELKNGTPALFLDFDGTLTPIVDRPADAHIDAAMRDTVLRLARQWPVAILSGRDLEDVRERVGIRDICYAGSHGFDIADPGGIRHEHPKGLATLPALDAAERALRAALAGIPGALVERKRFSIAAHYRLTAERDVPAVEQAVDTVLREYAELRKGHGKKVFEVQPHVDWDKGAALLWLLRALDLDRPGVRPVFIGDDVTDEHAFRAIADLGLGIAVLDRPRRTAARYQLRDPGEVRTFLQRLAAALLPAR